MTRRYVIRKSPRPAPKRAPAPPYIMGSPPAHPQPTPVPARPGPPLLTVELTTDGLRMVMEYDGHTARANVSRADAVRLHDNIRERYVLGASTSHHG